MNRQRQVQEAKRGELAVDVASADCSRIPDHPTSSIVAMLASIPFDERQIPERDPADIGRTISL